MAEQYFKIEDIPNELIDQDGNGTFLEASFGGQPYRLRLSTIVDRAKLDPPNRFLQLPTYTIDESTNEIAISANGRAYYNGQEQTIGADTLTYATVNTAGHSRFDAIVFNIAIAQYDLIQGNASDSPVTPSYDTAQNLLVAYVLINEDGTSSTQEPPQYSHEQGKDQTLDLGGANEVSAAELKAALNKLGYFAGYFPTEADLTSQPADAYALVGNPVGLWVYELDTDTWTLPTGSSVNYDEPYTFLFYSDLDPISAAITLYGPKEFVSPEPTPPKLTSVSYEVKLSSSSSYTAQADLTALNSWITANATTSSTAYDLRLIANYGGNTGEASATIYETITLTSS